MLQLRVAGSDKTYPLTKKTVVGSESSADIFLEGEEIKPTHCILTAAGSRVMLMVLDPSAVVEVNGEKALQKALKAGDVLTIGGSELTLEEVKEEGKGVGDPPPPSGATLPPVDSPPPGMPHPATAQAPVALVLKHGPGAGREFPIDPEAGPVTIGRDPGSKIVLDDPRVSANHGTLERDGDGWVFKDVGSSGGSRVNGIKVQSIPVSDGDELELGDSVLVLRVKPAAGEEAGGDAPAKVEAIGKIDDSATREPDAPAIGDGADAAKAPPIGGDESESKAPAIDAAADDSAATPLPGGDLAGAMESGPKGLRLEMTKGPDRGKEFELRDGVLKVGRAPDNDIVIGEKSVSGKHGELRVDGTTVTFTDTNSSAGSKVNGIKIESLALEPGDELSLGAEVVLVLRAPAMASPADVAGDDAAATPAPGAGAAPEPAPAPAPAAEPAAPAGPTLAIVKGPGKNTEVLLSKETTTVGRAPTNDIVIDEPSVSGSHGEFKWFEGRLEFRDTGSSAGSKVNGIKVDSLGLEEGDELQLGTVSLLRVVSVGAPAAAAAPAPAEPEAAAPEPEPLSPAAAAAAFDLPKRGGGAAGAYTLVGTSPGIDGKIFNLGDTAVIGSDPSAQIHAPAETGVAPKHAELFQTLSGPAIRRLEGAPEVLVQGVPVELLPLAHGDVIGLGQAQFIVRGSGKGVVKGGGAAPKSSATDVLTTRYRVVVKSGAHAGSEFKLVGLTRVGRDPRCDVVLTDPTVSGSHCEIAPVAGGWTVRDVGSSAGTMVGDLKATGDLPVKHGTVIKCGEVELRFEDTEAEIELAAAQPVPAATPAQPAPVKITGVRRRPRGAEPTAHARALLVVSGTERGVRWEFADKVTLGRLEGNDITLDNPEVSGEHAWLRLHDGGILLEDRGSTNGTRVNDEPVHTKLLQHGDVIEIQDFEFMYLEPDQPVPELDRYSRPSLLKLGDANKRLGRWRIPLTLTIGRASVHNVVLSDDTEVSGDHCKIVDRSGHFYLIDTSTNGTRVNGKKVKGEVRLHHSDVILIGASKFAFKDAHKSLEVQELRGSQIGVMLAALVVLALGIGAIGYFFVISDTGGKRERVNLLTVNHDFSQAEAGGNIPGWRFVKADEIAAAVSASGGGGFLEVKAGGGSVGPVMTFEAIYDGPLRYEKYNAYQLRGRVKAQGAETGGAALRLRFRLKGGRTWDRYTTWVADTNDLYQELKLTVRPPKDAEQVEVAAVTRGRAGIVRFDDVKLHAIALSEKEAEGLPNSAKVNVKDRFGTLTAEIDTQGVIALKRGDDRVFADVYFQLRGMPGLGARTLPRVDQLLSYTESMTSTPDGVLVELSGFDFATGQRVRYAINVRPTNGGTGDPKGGLKISAEFDGLTPHTSAGKVEAVVLCRGAAGREGRWSNRRRTSDGDTNESSNDFPAEIGVTHWVIGEQAGQTCLAFTPEAVVVGRYVEATKAVEGVAQLSSDFTGGALSLAVTTVGPGTAEEYQLHRQNIQRAQEVENGSVSPEYEAHKEFAKVFAWLTAEASASKQRMEAIESELKRDLDPLKNDCVELAEKLEKAAEDGVEPTPEDQARFGELITLLGEFRTKYGVIPGASEVDALETRLRTAMDNAGVGAKRKIVVAVLEEARAAHAAGNALKARILLEGLTVYQARLLSEVAERAEVFKLLTQLDSERDDAAARDKAFAKAKRAAALAEAKGDKAGAVAAWRGFLQKYADPVGGDLKLSAKAQEALKAIWNLTHPK